MKYIVVTERDGFDHRPYWDYLKSSRALMPPHIFEFASNTENHDLESPNSLHDSWLENWTIRELAEPDSRSHRSLQIEARFLGSRHDRYICLTYKSVGRYQITNPADFSQLPNCKNRGHDDLLVHEMRNETSGVFAHELVFSGGAVFLTEFSDFEHRIELL